MSGAVKTPAQLHRFVEILGEDLTFDFIMAFGGAELYFGKSAGALQNITDVVGAQKAQQLAAASAKFQRRIPVAKPWLAQTLKSKGLSVAQIARRLHSSDVAVRGWLKKAGYQPPPDPDPEQPKLL